MRRGARAQPANRRFSQHVDDKKRPRRAAFRAARRQAGAAYTDVESECYSVFAFSRVVSFSRIRADFPERPRK
jgi:hypothetical protein